MSEYVNLQYYFYNSISTTDNLILNEFLKDINDNVFIKNKKFLTMSSLTRKIIFDSKWNQNPQQFCTDFYKSQYFYPVILLINNIPTVFDFTSKSFETRPIITPSAKDILQLLG